MATEPTLGERILDAALQWAIELGKGRPGCQEDIEHQRLAALAARADAAERLAVALAEEVAGDNWHRLVAERTEALAAWRALGAVQP